jgi:hypothetical protein
MEGGGEREIVGEGGTGPADEFETEPGPGTSKCWGNVGVAATIPISGTRATLKAAGSIGFTLAASFIETARVLAEGPARGGLPEPSAWETTTLEALSK